jgi:hypothetical protein
MSQTAYFEGPPSLLTAIFIFDDNILPCVKSQLIQQHSNIAFFLDNNLDLLNHRG